MQQDNQSILFAVGINYKTAPIEIREKFYIREDEIPSLIKLLKETVAECVVLSTCNRTEIYGVTSRTDLDLDFYKDLLINFKGESADEISRENFFGLVSCSACQHLFQVSTSVDSKIVGDMQILGQIRGAYDLAKKHSASGKFLNQLFQRGLKIGKQARTETSLQRGAISISRAAVELAFDTFGSLENKTILIVGAGETARLTAECLIKKQVGKILIANRTRTHAEQLLESLKQVSEFNGEVVDFEQFKNYLNETDIVISSTSSPEPILQKADFVNQTNKILLIDIAVPRDIAPETAEFETVVLKNIDDLNTIIDKNFKRRMADLPVIQRIIMTEMSDFLIWYYSQPLLPETRRCGAKPDAATQTEILRVKDFLLGNLSSLHQLAMQQGAEDFNGHVELVNKLVAMKNSNFTARFQEVAA